MNSTALSAGEFAKHIGVNRRTVLDYCHRGVVKSFRTAGNQYRIARSEAIRYMEANHIPLNGLAEKKRQFLPRILVIESSNHFAETFATAGWEAIHCPALWLVGWHFNQTVQAVLIDSAGINDEAQQMVSWMRETMPALTVGLLTYDGQESNPDGVVSFRQPVRPENVVKGMRAAMRG